MTLKQSNFVINKGNQIIAILFPCMLDTMLLFLAMEQYTLDEIHENKAIL